MFKAKGWALAAAFCLNGAAWSAPEEVIGYVKTAEGEATLLVAGKQLEAKPGMPLLLGHVLKTGKQGSMGVTFKDSTMMSIGPDTQIVVDEYLYAPGKGDLKLGARMTRGSLQFISGVIAKLRPESVSLKTPTGSIGVRGTRFLVKVEGENE